MCSVHFDARAESEIKGKAKIPVAFRERSREKANPCRKLVVKRGASIGNCQMKATPPAGIA